MNIGMASFYSTPDKDDQSRLSLCFADIPIPRNTYKRFAAACVRTISFGSISAEELRAIFASANLELDQHLDIFQAQSIRRHTTRQFCIDNFRKMQSKHDEIVRAYNDGLGIIELSKKYTFSPFMLFREIMARDSYGAIARGARPEDVLSERDAREFRVAQEYDFDSLSVQLKIAEDANKRENNFIAYLRDLGISLRTQSELYKEALAKKVHPITPDALFTSPVLINGKRAYWADFKAYCGIPIPYLCSKTAEQAAKYNRAFGPGVMVYEHGYVAGLPYAAVSARALRNIIDEGIAHPTILI